MLHIVFIHHKLEQRMLCPWDGRVCNTEGNCVYPCPGRKRLDKLGVPADMTADDVLALFSLPDDDDSMHSYIKQVNDD